MCRSSGPHDLFVVNWCGAWEFDVPDSNVSVYNKFRMYNFIKLIRLG